MKVNLFLSLILIVGISCSNKEKTYPNISTEELHSKLKWDMNYSTVKDILIKNFQLGDEIEINQGAWNKTYKVYEYEGGKYNNIETHSWVASFENDSLRLLLIKIAKEKPQENRNIFKNLVELNNKELERDTTNISPGGWHFIREGKYISDVRIQTHPDTLMISVLMSKPFINT